MRFCVIVAAREGGMIKVGDFLLGGCLRWCRGGIWAGVSYSEEKIIA